MEKRGRKGKRRKALRGGKGALRFEFEVKEEKGKNPFKTFMYLIYGSREL